jgi:glycosyltransferase involved in cell wall biosynthesis
MQSISAYIPCHNNQETISGTIQSLRAQSYPISELFVVDDGSTDRSTDIVEAEGVPVVRLNENKGRGYIRALAMEQSANDFVLCCDAGKTIEPDFLARAVGWLEHDNVCAVQGRMVQPAAASVVDRWQGRHLFKSGLVEQVKHGASFVTAAALVKRSVVLSVGNYDVKCRHTEDKELGERLSAAGYDIVQDPALRIIPPSSDSLADVFERRWRWYAAAKDPTVTDYLKEILFSLKVMSVHDVKEGDVLSVPLSLIWPHYSFFRSRLSHGRD